MAMTLAARNAINFLSTRRAHQAGFALPKAKIAMPDAAAQRPLPTLHLKTGGCGYDARRFADVYGL